MTLQLAGFFRLSLGLEEEVPDGAQTCTVPPMIIQPLVENAVKHGIAGLPDGGKIRIAAHRTGSQLHIVMDNAMDDGVRAAAGSGIGLVNVRAMGSLWWR